MLLHRTNSVPRLPRGTRFARQRPMQVADRTLRLRVIGQLTLLDGRPLALHARLVASALCKCPKIDILYLIHNKSSYAACYLCRFQLSTFLGRATSAERLLVLQFPLSSNTVIDHPPTGTTPIGDSGRFSGSLGRR